MGKRTVFFDGFGCAYTDYADKPYKRGRIARRIWRWFRNRAESRDPEQRGLKFGVSNRDGLEYVGPVPVDPGAKLQDRQST